LLVDDYLSFIHVLLAETPWR